MPDSTDAQKARTAFTGLQDRITEHLLLNDPTCHKVEDQWDRDEGGGGITRAFAQGDALEKGGINFSDVVGKELPPSATQTRPELGGLPFRAMGVSVVFHPYNPYVPTSHANIRYFEAGPKTTLMHGGLEEDLTLHLTTLFMKMLLLGIKQQNQFVIHSVSIFTMNLKVGVTVIFFYLTARKLVGLVVYFLMI